MYNEWFNLTIHYLVNMLVVISVIDISKMHEIEDLISITIQILIKLITKILRQLHN